MNQNISIEKIFEMYGRLALERDLMREQIERSQAKASQPAAPGSAPAAASELDKGK